MDTLVLSSIKMIVALAVPTLVALFIPRRWRGAGFGAWLAFPFVAMFVVGVAELARDPSAFGRLDLVFQAFMSGLAFVALPWVIYSAVGFGLGTLLRRSRGPKNQPSPPVAPPSAQAWATEGWRVSHIGFEADELTLDGLDIWKLKWRRLDLPTVELPHPAHPQQMHRFNIYDVGDGARSTRFAACELSNGVWGFYSPQASDKPPQRTAVEDAKVPQPSPYHDLRIAPDGSLRVALVAVEWANGQWVNSPRVTEIATGRVLLDLWNTDWDAEVSFPEARSVALDLRRFRALGRVQAEIDLDRLRFAVGGGVFSNSAKGPIGDLRAELEKRLPPSAVRPSPPAPAPRRRRIGARQWLVTLMILIGALLAIGAGTYVTLQLHPPAAQTLTPLPKMPG